MRDTKKKIVSIIAAVACLGATFSFVGCGSETYKQKPLDGYVSDAEVKSNGGFAVEKGDYIYFINGVANYTDDNTLGKVEKGALMRISKADLNAGKNEADVVVPSLFVAPSYTVTDVNKGIYIHDDYVYFATPSTSKNSKGEVQNTKMEFKRAKLDGSEVMTDYYFRLDTNTANYRFVKEGDTVYCLYEEDGALKSFNTDTKKSETLVSGAEAYFYDTEVLDNPNVYYTMTVKADIDSDNASTSEYNQIYTVNASAKATANKADATYTVTGKGYEKKYAFDKKYLEENKKENGYDLGDYKTYPYVNLGKLVVDGVGINSKIDERFNWNGKDDAFTPDGYKYTINSYKNGGVYFKREALNKTSSDTENAKLYFLADQADSEWNAVKANDKADVVAVSANADTALLLYENGKHEYLYVENETLYKATASTKLAMAYKVGTPTLYKVEGDYLYYYATGTNGNNLSRINYKGTAENDDYSPLLNKEEYQPITLAVVDWNSAWYAPEFFGDKVLFSNAQSFGAVSYNYIYAANLGTTEAIKASNEAYEEVQEYITNSNNDSETQTAMQFYFRNASAASVDTVKEIFVDNTKLLEKFDAFVAKFESEFKAESAFVSFIGKQTEADAETIKEAFINEMKPSAEETEEEKGLATWAIVLIVVGSVLVVGAGVAVAWILISKKKKEKKAEVDATVNAYKRVIDTTDDKSIDVYADEDAETAETKEEKAEEVAEEPACQACEGCKATEEAPAEETSESEE